VLRLTDVMVVHVPCVYILRRGSAIWLIHMSFPGVVEYQPNIRSMLSVKFDIRL